MKPELQAIVADLYDKEATDELLYSMLAERTKSEHNREVLLSIAKDEKRHAATWGALVDRPARINRLKLNVISFMARIFGLVFAINLMEKGETDAVEAYENLAVELPVALEVLKDEKNHEEKLVELIKEEKLSYISSMVLGLNDALVELTGALAGFTLALNDNTLIGLAGFITGVAATLSMAASEYLAKKADVNEAHPLKAATYTGMAYLFTVALLLLPYALFSSPLLSLACSLGVAALIILGFTYFVSIVRKSSFIKGFREMILISASVAGISFLIGWAAKTWLGIDF